MPSMTSVCFALVQSLQRQIVNSDDSSIIVKVLPLMKILAIDIFGIVSMGTDFCGCRTLEPSPIAKVIDFMSDELTRRASSPFNPLNGLYCIPSMQNIRYLKKRSFLRSLLNTIIESRKMEMNVSNEDGMGKKDLLSNLLYVFKTQKESGQESKGDKFSIHSSDNFTDLFLSLLFAGYETTAITVTYALYCVAKCPKVEERCLRELESVIVGPENDSSDSSNKNVPSFDPKKLAYCRAVILETLRLYPPTPTLSRCLQRPLGVDGVELPKGIRIFLHIWSIQRDERNFPRPLEFIPERWVRRDNNCAKNEQHSTVW
eukprot:7719382-Ditylum_brightwellii.AAC.1